MEDTPFPMSDLYGLSFLSSYPIIHLWPFVSGKCQQWRGTLYICVCLSLGWEIRGETPERKTQGWQTDCQANSENSGRES